MKVNSWCCGAVLDNHRCGFKRGGPTGNLISELTHLSRYWISCTKQTCQRLLRTWWAVFSPHSDLRVLRKLSHYWRKRSTLADAAPVVSSLSAQQLNSSTLPLFCRDRASEWLTEKLSNKAAGKVFLLFSPGRFGVVLIEELLGNVASITSGIRVWIMTNPERDRQDNCGKSFQLCLFLQPKPSGETNWTSHSNQPCRSLSGSSVRELLQIPDFFSPCIPRQRELIRSILSLEAAADSREKSWRMNLKV